MHKLCLLIFCFFAFLPCFAQDDLVVGAIRWDAWTGGNITNQVEKTLSPQKYHNRLPWFAEIINKNTVKINGGTQAIMDREIGFASDAGLDYWAFLIYKPNNSLSKSLDLYLKSKKRKNINFCIILHNTLEVSESEWLKERDRLISLMKEPGYQKVLGNRPLLYAFQGASLNFERFKDFLSTAKKKNVNPYCVFMYGNPPEDYKKSSRYGFDAVSAYAYSSKKKTYSELVHSVEDGFWKYAAQSKVPFVPLVTAGWDKWPRVETPVSWEKNSAYHKQKSFPSRAKASEIANLP